MTLYTFCVKRHIPYKKTIIRLLDSGIIKRNIQNAYYTESTYFDNSTKKFQKTKTNRLLVNSETIKLFFTVEKNAYNSKMIPEFRKFDDFVRTLLLEQGDYFMAKLLEEGMLKACHITVIDGIYPDFVKTITYNGKNYITQLDPYVFNEKGFSLSCVEVDVVKALAIMNFFNKRAAKNNAIFPIFKYAKSLDIIAFKSESGNIYYAFSEKIIPSINNIKVYKKFYKNMAWICAMNKRFEERYRRHEVKNKTIFHWTEKDAKRCKKLAWYQIWYDSEEGYPSEEQINPIDRFDENGILKNSQRMYRAS